MLKSTRKIFQWTNLDLGFRIITRKASTILLVSFPSQAPQAMSRLLHTSHKHQDHLYSSSWKSKPSTRDQASGSVSRQRSQELLRHDMSPIRRSSPHIEAANEEHTMPWQQKGESPREHAARPVPLCRILSMILEEVAKVARHELYESL